MTSARSLVGLLFALAVCSSVPTLAFAADAPPPPPQQAVPADTPPPAAVFVRTLDDQGRGVVVATPAPPPTGPTIDSVLSMMRKLGMITASAGVMLLGSAVAGVLLAGLVLLIRKRREQRAAS